MWVFANSEDVFYLYRPDRKADFLTEFLADFNGVLVTDFYSGYDSLDCAKQKCLVHFLRDLNDLIIQAGEAVDLYRDMLTEQSNVYNSGISSRMNDIMKVLTIFAAIFIPLTFIAGIYGTNFDHIPELHFRYSYYVFWAVMIAVAISMLLYFRRKKWL